MNQIKIKVIRPFSWSPNGLEVLRFRAGVQMVPEKAAHIGCSRGWAERFDQAAVQDPQIVAEAAAVPKRRGRKPKTMG